MVAKGEVVCDHHRRRKMRVGWVHPTAGCWSPGVHSNCICNEIDALGCRSLAPYPFPDDAQLGRGFRDAYARIRSLAGRYCGTRWSHLETAESYDGSLRRRYVEAERSLRMDGPVSSRDAHLRAFLKAEKIGVSKFAKPRMIFPRSPRFNLDLATWLKPFEHWLWGRLTARRLFGGSNTRVVAKGLSPRQRANLIARKFAQFKDCVVFEVDGSAFEAHITSRQLLEEHGVYKSAYPGDTGLSRLLRYQLFMKGTTSHGLKFFRPGGRASGDYNTGMGNTLTMLAAVVSAVKGRAPFDVLADGDNALIFVPASHWDVVVKGFHERVLAECGHEMVLEKPTRHLEGVRFGQSAPVHLGHGLGWTMVRDPWKVLSTAYASHRWLNEPKGGLRWIAGVSRCELSVARGVPVLQEIALKMHLATESLKPLGSDAYRDYFVVGAWLAGRKDVIRPSREARLSFERAFGVSPSTQLQWESVDVQPSMSFVFVEHHNIDGLWEADPGLLEPWADARI